MTPLPPHAQAIVDELLDCAPPLSPEQQRVIRQLAPRPAEATAPAA